AGDVDGWRDPDAALRQADAAVVSCHSPAAGRCADYRIGSRLQSVEYFGTAQAIPGAGGSVDRQRGEARRGFFVRALVGPVVNRLAVCSRAAQICLAQVPVKAGSAVVGPGAP